MVISNPETSVSHPVDHEKSSEIISSFISNCYWCVENERHLM